MTKLHIRSLARSILKAMAISCRLEISTPSHALLKYRQLFLINKYRHVANIGEINESHQVCCSPDPIIVLSRQICERDSEERASKAIADNVYLTLAGRSLDSRKCGKRTFEHVILEAFMSETPVRIDPGNHEYRMSLIHSPLDERIFQASDRAHKTC